MRGGRGSALGRAGDGQAREGRTGSCRRPCLETQGAGEGVSGPIHGGPAEQRAASTLGGKATGRGWQGGRGGRRRTDSLRVGRLELGELSRRLRERVRAAATSKVSSAAACCESEPAEGTHLDLEVDLVAVRAGDLREGGKRIQACCRASGWPLRRVAARLAVRGLGADLDVDGLREEGVARRAEDGSGIERAGSKGEASGGEIGGRGRHTRACDGARSSGRGAEEVDVPRPWRTRLRPWGREGQTCWPGEGSGWGGRVTGWWVAGGGGAREGQDGAAAAAHTKTSWQLQAGSQLHASRPRIAGRTFAG